MSTTQEQSPAPATRPTRDSPAAGLPADPGTSSSPYHPCDSCGAPLDDRQRYCVSCGTRRKHAEDPAARFLAQATRRRRSPVARAGAGSGAGRRSASLATVILIAVVPLALGAGVLIGRSSAGGDGKLIAALRAEKAPVIEYSGTAAATGAGQAVGGPKVRVGKGKGTHTRSARSAKSSAAGKVLTTTRYGSATQVTGYKPSAAALSQGASVANSDSHATGTAASGAGLPSVVAVP